jgi:hypothetical protein
MTSILKVDTIQTAAGGTPTAADLGLNVTGGVLQVVSFNTTTQTQTTSTSYIDTAITASITPSSTSSKVLIIVACPVDSTTATAIGTANQKIGLFRGATELSRVASGTREGAGAVDYVQSGSHISYLDSPASASSVTYTVKIRSNSTSTTITVPQSGDGGNIILMEIAG